MIPPINLHLRESIMTQGTIPLRLFLNGLETVNADVKWKRGQLRINKLVNTNRR